MNDPQTTKSGDYKEYRFESSWEGDGKIFNREEKLLWEYKSMGRTRFAKGMLYGFFRLPGFVVQPKAGQNQFSFTRIKRFPRAIYEIKEGDHAIGTARPSGFLWTKYRVEFQDGLGCTFHLPLFTVLFKGTTDQGGQILIRLWQHRIWYARFDAAIDDARLVAAIAFLHRERLRHG